VFSTRIAYVARFPQRFELHVADADGLNSQFILAHKERSSRLVVPDGTRIAYVSSSSAARSSSFTTSSMHPACSGCL